MRTKNKDILMICKLWFIEKTVVTTKNPHYAIILNRVQCALKLQMKVYYII